LRVTLETQHGKDDENTSIDLLDGFPYPVHSTSPDSSGNR
jgi:hypothetical protein